MDSQLASLYSGHIETLTRRHRGALEAEQYDWLILYSGLPRYLFLDDRTATFAANPHFRTWAPLPDHAGGAVVLSGNGDRRLVFFQPEDYWHAAPNPPDPGWARHFDLRVITDSAAIGGCVDDLDGRVAIIGDETTPEILTRLGQVNPHRLIHRLHFDRARKTEYEVECMRRANAIAVRGHRAAEQAFRDGATEFEINLAYNRACRQETELPYDSIVALNEHGAVLHYTDRDVDPPDAHRSFLIDAGASCNGYAADITRTYSTHDDDFQALIASVDGLQKTLCSRMVDGADYVTLHEQAHALIAEALREHGIVTCSTEAAISGGITTAFFPHGLGHYIGTQVHDVGGHQATPEGELREPPGRHPFLRLTRTLTPGAVCTVEPGLYFIDMLLAGHAGAAEIDWDKVEAYKPYGGIRIEDDVHVTASGPQNLTREQFARH